MKKSFINICLSAFLGAFALSLTSCGDELKAYPWIKEEDGGPVTTVDMGERDMDVLERQLRTCIPFMLNYSHEPDGSWAPHNYQYDRANNVDNYAGYWTTTKANFAYGPALPTLYTDNNGYIGGPLESRAFQYGKSAINAWNKALTYDPATGDSVLIERPEWRAIALICEGFVAQQAVDATGACPFNDWRNQKTTLPLTWEAGPEVYKQVLADLDEAIASLKAKQPGQGDLQRVEGTDAQKTCTGWNWRNWVKFANSLKLRMAMNMVDYNDPDPVYGPDSKPFVARNIAEEAVNDEIGVLLPTDERDIAYYMVNNRCCWYFMAWEWNDIRLNASLENILKHFKSPLLTELFSAGGYPVKSSSGATAPAGIYGVRAGIMMEDTGSQQSGYGSFGLPKNQYMTQPFFKRTEATFLRAEGALRGWNMGGSAQELYEQGIRLSFEENGIADQADAYLAQDNLPAVPYRDYYNRKYDTDGRVTCGVKWDDADSQELKLEKLITQKWIAIFPQGMEAWSTYRRTGYPRLFPVVENNMANVDTELQIRRTSVTQTVNNGAEIAQLTELLGGSQDCGTHVFWDVRSANWQKDANGRIIPVNF